jgi:hypothetical protein
VRDQDSILKMLNSYHLCGYNLIPLKSQAKIPLGQWEEHRLIYRQIMPAGVTPLGLIEEVIGKIA